MTRRSLVGLVPWLGAYLVAPGEALAQCTWSSTFGMPGTNGPVHALVVHDDGTGPALYAGGAFTTAGGVAANRVARWDGTSWSSLGSGTDAPVLALATLGGELYAGGAFSTAGGQPAARVARWDGASWSPLGSGISGNWAIAFSAFDDGGGEDLYVGGDFTSAGGVTTYYIARWDGFQWSALAGRATGPIFDMITFDDGGGEQLYIGGFVSILGDPTTEYVARWDGSQWSGLDPATVGMGGSVVSMATFDDGGGEQLYLGGYFQEAGGMTADFIARYDGSAFSPVTSGMDAPVSALTVFDDGTGPGLYAGGRFTSAGGVSAGRIARWDGASWSALGSGLGACASPSYDCVQALAVFDDGAGADLIAGGYTPTAGGNPSHYIASWGCGQATGVAVGRAAGAYVLATPNPSRTDLAICFGLGRAAPAHGIPVRLEVFDVSGRKVRALARSVFPGGEGCRIWDGRGDAEGLLGPGVYFLRAAWPGFEKTERIVRVR